MKASRLFLQLSLLGIYFTLNAQQKTNSKDFHTWAPVPPMGWNSWDCYGPTVTEEEVKANTDYMAAKLKNLGWEYVVVDIRWYVANDKAHGYNQTDPQYSIDEYGRFTPAVNRFPSAAGGKGFKPLADYIHSKGLKFGIHIMRGIPVIAVKQKLPVKGTDVTAADIFSDKDQCRWLRDMYTIVPEKTGSQEYYNSLFELYASWGLDFVKVDDLSSPIYFSEEVEMIRKAIDRTGRKILLSTSPGETPLDKATHVQDHANMWRTVGDFWDSWLQLKEHFDVFSRWNAYRKPGAYPDGDMLPLGRLAIRAERGNDRMTAFTKNEQVTLMTLWSIFKSPLMFGGDFPSNDDWTLSLISNKDVLDVLKYSTNNKELYHTKEKAAWTADDPATGDKYLALFNIADQEDMVESRAVYSSKTINRNTTGNAAAIDADISGTEKLYLAVSDAGDGIDWDHADWINPMLYKGKDSLALTSLKWTKARSGWGNARANQSVSGSPLIVNEKQYTTGIGTHSNSVIEYTIPAGYTRLKVLAGLDKAGVDQNSGASVKFMVFTKDPAGAMPPESAKITVSFKELGISGSYRVKDLWTGKDLGSFTGEFGSLLGRHGAGMYRLSKVK